MQRMLKIFVTLVAFAATSGLAAYAARPGANDALVTSHARISLVQAVQAAEGRLQGQAVKAELEASREGWIYDVEVVAREVPYDVAVDAVTGTVVASTRDRTDADDGGDARD